MKESLKDFHKILYTDKSKQFVFMMLCTTVFIYGFMYRIIDLRSTFWCAIPFCLYYVFENQNNPFDINFLYIFTSMTILATIAFLREPWLNTYWSDIKLAWVFPMVYMLGYVSIGDEKKLMDEKAFWAVHSLGLGMYFQAILDHIMYLFHPVDGPAAWYSFWKDDWELRTVFGIGFLIVISSLFYAVKIRKKDKALFITTLLFCLVSCTITLLMQGRTTACIMIVVFGICFFFDAILNYANYSKKNKLIIKCTLLVCVLAVIILLCAFSLNIFGLKDLYNNSFLSRDGGVLKNIRISAAIEGIINTIKTPEGGWQTTALPTTHNTWLEISRRYNTIVFAIFIMYVFNTMVNMIRLLISKKDNSLEKYYLAGAVFSLFIYLSLETVGFTQNYYYIIFFIFISGIVNKKASMVFKIA